MLQHLNYLVIFVVAYGTKCLTVVEGEVAVHQASTSSIFGSICSTSVWKTHDREFTSSSPVCDSDDDFEPSAKHPKWACACDASRAWYTHPFSSPNVVYCFVSRYLIHKPVFYHEKNLFCIHFCLFFDEWLGNI